MGGGHMFDAAFRNNRHVVNDVPFLRFVRKFILMTKLPSGGYARRSIKGWPGRADTHAHRRTATLERGHNAFKRFLITGIPIVLSCMGVHEHTYSCFPMLVSQLESG